MTTNRNWEFSRFPKPCKIQLDILAAIGKIENSIFGSVLLSGLDVVEPFPKNSKLAFHQRYIWKRQKCKLVPAKTYWKSDETIWWNEKQNLNLDVHFSNLHWLLASKSMPSQNFSIHLFWMKIGSCLAPFIWLTFFIFDDILFWMQIDFGFDLDEISNTAKHKTRTELPNNKCKLHICIKNPTTTFKRTSKNILYDDSSKKYFGHGDDNDDGAIYFVF